MTKNSYVYILASRKGGVLYIGVTSDLAKRIFDHKSKIVKGFTSRYNVDRLVYYEVYEDIEMAIMREKLLKDWQRSWKVELIERDNKNWEDLYFSL